MRTAAFLGLVLSLTLSASAAAMPDHLSKPQYIAPQDTIPAPQDIAYPGTMQLEVDARDHDQGIFRITQTIPVAQAGPLTLLYPEWLPGNHAPRGEIEKLTGLQAARRSPGCATMSMSLPSI